jgi:hypothetical protein
MPDTSCSLDAQLRTLTNTAKWRPRLHHLGEFEIKHGVKIDIVNLYTDEIGNPALPEKLKGKRLTPRSRSARSSKAIVITALLAGLALILWFFAYRGEETSAVFVGKSVAILPFKPLVPANRDEVLEAGMAGTSWRGKILFRQGDSQCRDKGPSKNQKAHFPSICG